MPPFPVFPLAPNVRHKRAAKPIRLMAWLCVLDFHDVVNDSCHLLETTLGIEMLAHGVLLKRVDPDIRHTLSLKVRDGFVYQLLGQPFSSLVRKNRKVGDASYPFSTVNPRGDKSNEGAVDLRDKDAVRVVVDIVFDLELLPPRPVLPRNMSTKTLNVVIY